MSTNFGTKQGAILKPVTGSRFTYFGDNWARYNQTYDTKVPLFDEQKARIIELCHLVTQGNDAEFAERIGEYMDIPQLARCMAVMVFLSDMDGILGPGQNLYLYLHPKSQRVTFLPWDQDHSWGQFPMRGTAEQEAKDDGDGPPENIKERDLRIQLATAKRLLADKTLEVDFFKGALQKVEARRQRSTGAGGRGSTNTSESWCPCKAD